jgi:outer membrane protein assembly factor BamB
MLYTVKGSVVHALDTASGQQRWTHTIGTHTELPPVVHRGTLYVLGANGVLYALSA